MRQDITVGGIVKLAVSIPQQGYPLCGYYGGDNFRKLMRKFQYRKKVTPFAASIYWVIVPAK